MRGSKGQSEVRPQSLPKAFRVEPVLQSSRAQVRGRMIGRRELPLLHTLGSVLHVCLSITVSSPRVLILILIQIQILNLILCAM